MKTFLLAVTLAVAVTQLPYTVHAHPEYQTQIPNGRRVPSPCQTGAIWLGVGHQSPAGGNMRNPFGLDFKAAGFTWTAGLCRKDSDGDGLTNGQELGDPDCVWTPGATPARTVGLSHPGICPLDSTTCINTWEVCPKPFSCPAMSDPAVFVRNFTINSNTPVPTNETTYICQAFELNNTASPVHMIGSKPLIVNKNVMHHMLMYACSKRPDQAMFDAPQLCFMGSAECTEIINLWGFGLEGECFNSNAGFRIGGSGYRFAILQMHWNNPNHIASYTDSSGLSLYFTPNLRAYDQGTLMYGEVNLVLPPRQPMINFNHTCPGVCTSRYHSETRYITAAGIHMHTYGIQGRISLWRNGILVKDLSPLQVYDYSTPQMIPFEPPIEYRQGDEVKTECYFSTLKTNTSVFYGEGTQDEMCFSFLSYYPNNVSLSTQAKLGQCAAVAGINQCWLTSGVSPQVEQQCNITAMRSGELPTKVLADMTANKCFSKTGCDPVCRDYLHNTLWPMNACYDPRRARQMAEVMAAGIFVTSPVSLNIATTLFGQRFCEREIGRLAEMDRQAAAMVAMTTPTAPPRGPPPPTGLTPEHLLIVIIVCSCLGFALVVVILAFIAARIRSASSRGSDGKAAVYKVADNEAVIAKEQPISG